jgi:hypothetical protein
MHSSPFRNHRVIGVAVLALGLMLGHSEEARAGERTLFVRSAIENADGTVTLPLYRGTSRGRLVWFVILDTSNGQHADLLGVNRAQKLVHVRGTLAVQE